ncbi:thioredoxin, partial [archaeon]
MPHDCTLCVRSARALVHACARAAALWIVTIPRLCAVPHTCRDELASRYADVVFMKVMDDDCPELIAANGVRAFPTFQFFIANKRVHEMRGANPGGLEQAVREWKGKAVSSVGFSGTGMALGGDVARTPAEITAARLRAMAASASAPAVGAPSAVVAAADGAPTA